ncbi:hypothetical protein C0995_008917 [Termitomyces sp. Mi166|nr:hypothetical protein C0995_008913 [Termitomyces sp. Mi166\
MVTLVTTATTSFGLLTIAAWFGYEQYIAPLLLPDAPWRPLGKRIHEWNSSMSEKSRPLASSDHHRIRTGSLSDYSIGSTRSGSFSFILTPRELTTRLPSVSKILNKLPGLCRETGSSEQDPSLDPENHASHFPTNKEAEVQTGMRLRRVVKLVLTLKAASKAFKQRSRNHGNAVTSPVTTNMTPTRTPANDMLPIRSPFLLSIPDKPLSKISLPVGAIQDIEYSPNGQYLAVTWYDKKIDVQASTTAIYTATLSITIAVL